MNSERWNCSSQKIPYSLWTWVVGRTLSAGRLTQTPSSLVRVFLMLNGRWVQMLRLLTSPLLWYNNTTSTPTYLFFKFDKAENKMPIDGRLKYPAGVVHTHVAPKILCKKKSGGGGLLKRDKWTEINKRWTEKLAVDAWHLKMYIWSDWWKNKYKKVSLMV